jgi:hypothetical protein
MTNLYWRRSAIRGREKSKACQKPKFGLFSRPPEQAKRQGPDAKVHYEPILRINQNSKVDRAQKLSKLCSQRRSLRARQTAQALIS